MNEWLDYYMENISMSNELQQIAQEFETTAQVLSGLQHVEREGYAYDIELHIYFDPTLYRHGRVGGYAIAIYNNQQFGYSYDVRFTPGQAGQIDCCRLVNACARGVYDRVFRHVSKSSCSTCGGQGWYVDFMIRKPCEDCQWHNAY